METFTSRSEGAEGQQCLLGYPTACSRTNLSPVFSGAQSEAMDGEHLHLADSSLTRSSKAWPRDHGPSDAARHYGLGVVLCGGGEGCQSQTSQSRSRASDASP